MLRVPPEELDARRFEALSEQGRRELARGDADRASTTLRAALALWRGPALADLGVEPFAQIEIARLDELRLAALESRIEADLALRRHRSLVAELETLVAAHPYHEGLRTQLMLALYRSGRQAEALETYRRTRRTFSEELGIEPGPRLQELERAILRHDSSLEAPAPEQARTGEQERGEPVGQKRRIPVRRSVALAALALLVSAGLVTAARESPGRSPAPVTLKGNSVAVIDPEAEMIEYEIPVSGRPTGAAVGEGSVWVGNRDDKTLLRIDPRTRGIVRTLGLGVEPTAVAVGAGSVWVLSAGRALLLRIDPATNEVVARVRLPEYPWYDIEVGATTVWACACGIAPGTLARIDVTTSVVSVHRGPVAAIEFGAGALWALTGYEADTIERIDERTHATLERIPFERIGAVQGYQNKIAAGAGAVWVTSPRALWRIDPALNRITGSVSLGRGRHLGDAPQAIATDGGTVWVTTYDGILLRVDAEAQTLTTRIELGPLIYTDPVADAIAVGEGAVWLSVTSFAS